MTDIRAGKPGISYPHYTGGERNGPPEDCAVSPASMGCSKPSPIPRHPDHADAKERSADYDPNSFDELPIKYVLGRIAGRRNAARSRLAKKKTLRWAA